MSYSSIAITAPDSAEQGAVVPMSTKITNITAVPRLFRIKLYAMRDIYEVPTSEETIGTVEVVIGSGQTQEIRGTFIMPAWDAIVLIMVYRFVDYWDFDVYATKVVSLVGGLAGSLIKKELEYAGITKALPVAGVPKDVRAKLHVWGQNDMSISQGMGIYWLVYDPNGGIAEEYTDWGGTIGSKKDHEFISSGQFDLNKLGKYTTWIKLLMGSQDSPVVVAEFTGEVCMVVPAEPFIHQFSIADYKKV